MRYLIVVIIVVCASAILLAASAGSDKIKCAACGKEIKEGDYVAYVLKRGIIVPVHFKHAFDDAMEERFKPLAKK